jgi:hypothetical protein
MMAYITGMPFKRPSRKSQTRYQDIRPSASVFCAVDGQILNIALYHPSIRWQVSTMSQGTFALSLHTAEKPSQNESHHRRL